ncbi:MAG: 3-oxoacyl-ACP reductase FabG [Gammaproteobacteria bacterium]|nr:3-oxoacyl-ACP reductase FabG [Gammaproteobacteria bacterium]
MSNDSNLFSLDGEIALVTGATRGIGAEIANQLAAAGAEVIGTATTPNGAGEIVRRLGDGHAGRVLDAGSDQSVQALMVGLGNRAPTILVNNAGIARDNLLLRMKPQDWQQVINTNLSSAYRLCKAVLRGMLKARRGRIINLSSVVGMAGAAGQGNYAAAKAGLLGFTRALALEVAGRGITVNAIAPGYIETDMTAGVSAARQEAVIGSIPAGRAGTPLDVAAAAVFLASPAAAYVTGATLHVNGGLWMG